jgi:phage repressor protein C with HTH and peptisase S24 domain
VSGPDDVARAEALDADPDDPAFTALVAAVLGRGARVRFRATGSSMAPAIADGDNLTVEPAGGGQLRLGEVLLVRRGGAVLAHRLAGRRRRPGGSVALVLRGDAAECDDPPADPADVLGRVVEAERDGVRRRPSSWPARIAARGRLWARRVRRRLRG